MWPYLDSSPSTSTLATSSLCLPEYDPLPSSMVPLTGYFSWSYMVGTYERTGWGIRAGGKHEGGGARPLCMSLWLQLLSFDLN